MLIPLEGIVSRANAEYLQCQLGKWSREHAPNIKMLVEQSPIAIPLESNESAIAEISLGSGGSPIIVTDLQLMRDGETLLRYDELQHCIWIDRDRKMQVKLKVSHYQRLILERKDGSELILDGLGQTVFPLLRFFWFVLGRGDPLTT